MSFDNPFRATARQHSNGRCVPPLHEHYASSPRHRISQPAIFIHWQIISGRQIPTLRPGQHHQMHLPGSETPTVWNGISWQSGNLFRKHHHPTGPIRSKTCWENVGSGSPKEEWLGLLAKTSFRGFANGGSTEQLPRLCRVFPALSFPCDCLLL